MSSVTLKRVFIKRLGKQDTIKRGCSRDQFGKVGTDLAKLAEKKKKITQCELLDISIFCFA